ncbi:O-antigen ligase [Paenibacillus sp. NEAU-GSW1]|uniref:O-antigen ligase family protein n=1 Tax=Paenibacillus sp. NEAU-GSW1 TaxID=2682486 RepID=UPI0012E230A5|nr:O-antigen ligase family protein [Paenibacillus sp. NEAU-GSW1]MUT68051.1 hypothetical protein [Paenibacillus sp. NEAU-GSW1]
MHALRYILYRDRLIPFIAAIACILLSIALGFQSAKEDQLQMLIQLAFVLFASMTALFIYVSKPEALLPYCLFGWAFFPEARRVIDWSFMQFSDFPLLAMAPLLVNLTLLIPVVRGFHRSSKAMRKTAVALALIIAYGLIIGTLHYGSAAFYEGVSYVAPLLIVLYVHVCGFDGAVRDKWLKSAACIGLLAALYGIYQYFFIPPWDQFWMIHSGMTSIGHPSPLQVRVFSTLNSPGPAAVFLTMILGFMIVQRRWRAFGAIGTAAVFFALLITLVRSAWLGLLVMLFAYFLKAKAVNKLKLLSILAAGVLIYMFVLPNITGASTIMNRMETLTSLDEDVSYNARLSFASSISEVILADPIGRGLGASGLGTKLYANSKFESFDNGYLNLFFSFGVIGGGGFIAVLASLLIKLWKQKNSNDYVHLAIAGIMALLCLMMSVNVLTGVSGAILWFVVSIGFFQERSSNAAEIEARKEANAYGRNANHSKE